MCIAYITFTIFQTFQHVNVDERTGSCITGHVSIVTQVIFLASKLKRT